MMQQVLVLLGKICQYVLYGQAVNASRHLDHIRNVIYEGRDYTRADLNLFRPPKI